MCIICKSKELAVLQVQTVEALAETVGELLAVLDRVKGTSFAFGDGESAAMARAVALLRADDAPPADNAVSGPADSPEAAVAAMAAAFEEAALKGVSVRIVSIDELFNEPDNKLKH